jgi:hypothetical protein
VVELLLLLDEEPGAAAPEDDPAPRSPAAPISSGIDCTRYLEWVDEERVVVQV